VDYSKERGVDYFLEKPPNPEQIGKVIQKIIKDAEDSAPI
jgi:hypothetical protein